MTNLPPRIERFASLLPELGVDAMLITDEINVRYLSGFSGDSSYLLIGTEEATILSDGRYEAQIEEQCPGLPCRIRTTAQVIVDLAVSAIGDFSSAMTRQPKIGVEADHVSLALFNGLVSRCRGAVLEPTRGGVEQLRVIKDAAEIETTRRAVDVAERAFESLLPMLTRDWTERQIAHELEAKMRFLGAEGSSFAPIVAAGPGGALPHYEPTNRVLGDEATLLIDWGAKLGGYASDLTRTLHRPDKLVGAQRDRFRRAYEAVLESQLAAIEKIGPGVPVRDVDQAARNVLERHGMGDAFKHGLGHGVGLQIHESPRMSSISEECLASGMIVTVEPGVYFDGDFGIRIEDDVLVTDSGYEVLSRVPKGLEDNPLIL